MYIHILTNSFNSLAQSQSCSLPALRPLHTSPNTHPPLSHTMYTTRNCKNTYQSVLRPVCMVVKSLTCTCGSENHGNLGQNHIVSTYNMSAHVNTLSSDHSLFPSTPHLAVELLVQQDVPCSNVSVDKGLTSQAHQAVHHLLAELEQKTWQVGIRPWRITEEGQKKD